VKKVRRGTQKAMVLAYFADGRFKTVAGMDPGISYTARNRIGELEQDHGCTFERRRNWRRGMTGYRYAGPWPQPLEG
jgi:hypothetical protein